MKPAKRRTRRRRPSRLSPWLDRARSMSNRLAQPRIKRWGLIGLVGITALLILAFALGNALNALYVTVLVSGSLALMIWAWPRGLLGLSAVFLYTQPLLMFLGNSSYNYTKVIYSLWAISLLLVIWVIRLAWRQRAELELTRLVWPSLALLGAMLISLVNAPSFWVDAQYIVLAIYFAGFGVLCVNLVRDRDDVLFLVAALVASAGLTALYGLLQYFGVVPGYPGRLGPAAIISSFGNRNYLGGFLVYLYAPGLLLVLLARQMTVRVGAILALALLYASFVAIESDSVWLAWLVSMGILALGVLIFKLWRTVIENWPWLVGLVVATAVVFVGFQAGHALLPETDEEIAEPTISSGTPFMARAFRFVQDPALIAEIRTFRSRLIDWVIGYEMFADAPIVGIGLGDYKRQWLDYKAEFYPTELGQRLDANLEGRHLPRAAQAHNEYVQIGAEMGLLGLLATLAFIGWLLAEAIRRLQRPDDVADADGDRRAVRWMVLGLGAGIVAFMSDAFFSFPLHLAPNALALVTLVGLTLSPALGAPRRRVQLGPIGTRALAVGVLAVALSVSAFAYRDWLADIYLVSGAQLLGSGDQRGEQLVRTSVELDIAPGEQLYWLGSLYAWSGRPEQALAYLDAAQPVFNTEYSYYMRALAHYLNRDMASAQRAIDTLLAMDPASALQQEARYLQGVILSNQGQTEEARAMFEDLLQSDYQPVKIHINLAEVYLQMTQTVDARASLEQARSLIRTEQQSLSAQIDASEETSTGPDLDTDRQRYQELERLKQRVEQLLRNLER